MNSALNPHTILIANDDSSFCLLIEEAFQEVRANLALFFVEDGEQLLDYLYRRGPYQDPLNSPFPDLLLLDLNMPKLDGREALNEIKSDPILKTIPVVILSSSYHEEDISKCYDAGANSFIVNPLTFDKLAVAMQSLCNYWLSIVALPPKKL
ncbi:response regulator [Laspinema sp. A4]|uniref:response regulator n=1 Tax=Laspinema sp. D2d TaxID=2953686 RepID=UPI0021BAD507|nr:response regulator [Laspinema sp. D2d]MCT7985946.1 response regulator [Laspinema sp. D2d]